MSFVKMTIKCRGCRSARKGVNFSSLFHVTMCSCNTLWRVSYSHSLLSVNSPFLNFRFDKKMQIQIKSNLQCCALSLPAFLQNHQSKKINDRLQNPMQKKCVFAFVILLPKLQGNHVAAGMISAQNDGPNVHRSVANLTYCTCWTNATSVVTYNVADSGQQHSMFWGSLFFWRRKVQIPREKDF